MRIGIFSESYEPIINGVTVCVQTLRDELSRQGHDVFIFAPLFDGFEDPYDRVFRFSSRRTFWAKDYPLPVPYAPKIKESFRKLNLDIVHTQTPFFLGILGKRWARQNGIPIVSTNHTLYAEYAHYTKILPESISRWIIVSHMRRYYNTLDGIVAPSNVARNVLRSYDVRTRIDVITSGVTSVPDSLDRDAFRQRIGVGNDRRVLLYVGRLAKEKNLDLLLSAFRLICDRDESSYLAIVGGGPYEQHLREESSRLGLDNRLAFVGKLSRKDLDMAYAAADVFVWPSITETQGLAACEALSAGLPCVAINGGGTPECLENGMDSIVTNNDAGDFAASVLELLQDEGLHSRLSAGAMKNSARFSTTQMATNFIEFYDSIIADQRHGQAVRHLTPKSPTPWGPSSLESKSTRPGSA